MENRQANQAGMSMETKQITEDMISVPLQKLFDECISYISVSDFIMQ